MTDVAPDLLCDWNRNLNELAGQYVQLQPAAQESFVGRLLNGNADEPHIRADELEFARNDLLRAMAKRMAGIDAVMASVHDGWAGRSPFAAPDFSDLIVDMGWDRPST